MNSQVTKLTFVGFFFGAEREKRAKVLRVRWPSTWCLWCFFFFFRTLALIHSPPVSYTMPFPHQAMVRVADIGVWLNTTKAGGFTAAFPTPYNPKGNINQEKRVWINCQQELITISYCSMKWVGVLLLQLKCSWDGMLVFALVPSPPIFSEVPWQFMSTQLYSWSGKKNCPLGNRKTPRVRLKPRLFNPECSALILRLSKILLTSNVRINIWYLI